MSTSDKIRQFDDLIMALNKIIFGEGDVALDGSTKPTIDKFLKSIAANGWYEEPFPTESALLQSTPTKSRAVAKALDTKKVFYWDGSSWADTGLSELDLAKNYADLLDTKIGYYQTENLVNPTQATAVGYYTNGVPNGLEGHISALDYYPIAPGQKLWFRGNNGSNVVPVYAADKTFIRSLSYSDAVDGVLTVAESYGSKIPAFIRFSLFGRTSLENFNFGYGYLRPPTNLAYQEKYSVVNNKSFSETVGNDIFKKDNAALKNVNDAHNFDLYNNHLVLFRNLVNPNQELMQGYYNNVGIITPFLGLPNYYVTTEFIPIPLNRKFWVLGAGSGNLLQLCDVDKNPVLALSLSNVVGNKYTAPLTAGVNNTPIHYIRVGSSSGIDHIRNNGLGVGWLSDLGYLPTAVPPYNSDESRLSQQLLNDTATRLGISVNPLSDKRWAAMGDSITAANNCYADVLAARYGATLTKKAVGGGRVHRESVESPYFVMSEAYLDIPLLPAPDLITVAGGTNDPLTVEGADHLGVMSDRTVMTFYGALHVLLAGLRDRFPDARIGFMAPIPKTTRYIEGDTSNGPYLKWKAIKEVCAYYSVPCWNGNAEFGASPNDSTTWKETYMPDTLHPNNAGHIWYANRVEDFILSLAK